MRADFTCGCQRDVPTTTSKLLCLGYQRIQMPDQRNGNKQRVSTMPIDLGRCSCPVLHHAPPRSMRGDLCARVLDQSVPGPQRPCRQQAPQSLCDVSSQTCCAPCSGRPEECLPRSDESSEHPPAPAFHLLPHLVRAPKPTTGPDNLTTNLRKGKLDKLSNGVRFPVAKT